MYWYRSELGLGRFNIVGTTIQEASKLPEHIASDEKHTEQLGQRGYGLTTNSDCVLGVSVSQKANANQLIEAYGEFQKECEAVKKDDQPVTNNRDGWEAGVIAFQALFPTMQVIFCFLHEWLKIKTRCRSLKKQYQDGISVLSIVGNKIWEIYHAATKEVFEERVQEFRAWINTNMEEYSQSYIKEQLVRFCDKTCELAKAYDFNACLRTSNAVDRPMKRLDKVLFNIQYFHGHLYQANQFLRAWALIYNFAPYNPKTRKKTEYISPTHKVNGFVYHQNWLQNLLICGSLNGGNGRLRALPQNMVE